MSAWEDDKRKQLECGQCKRRFLTPWILLAALAWMVLILVAWKLQ